MESIKFRKAIPKDLDFFRRAVSDLEEMQFDKSAFESTWKEVNDNPNHTYLVAEINSDIVGYISLRIETQLHHTGKVAEILELYVLPEFRNKKIGSLLIEEAISIAKNNNCKIIEVATNKIRAEALKFYTGKGFEMSHIKSVRKLE